MRSRQTKKKKLENSYSALHMLMGTYRAPGERRFASTPVYCSISPPDKNMLFIMSEIPGKRRFASINRVFLLRGIL